MVSSITGSTAENAEGTQFPVMATLLSNFSVVAVFKHSYLGN